MSKTLRFYPNEATQEIVQKIEADASTPAANFASNVPAPQHCAKKKNTTVHTHGTKPFRNKIPK